MLNRWKTLSEFNHLELVCHEPDSQADSCIIWLHGLGADGYDFAPLTPVLRQSCDLPGLRAIYPHAPQLPVTINGGVNMPAWYDILAASPRRTINSQQFNLAVDAIQRLVQQQVDAGIPAERIIVAGFSQGGAVAYQAALGCQHPLGGLICLSTYIATDLSIQPANQQLPVFLAHGTQDMVVPVMLGQEACETLQQQGLTPEWRSYPIQHEVCDAELEEIAAFIRQCLG